jgi:hypothetical protein
MQHEIAMLKESNLAMQAALTKLASKDERLATFRRKNNAPSPEYFHG